MRQVLIILVIVTLFLILSVRPLSQKKQVPIEQGRFLKNVPSRINNEQLLASVSPILGERNKTTPLASFSRFVSTAGNLEEAGSIDEGDSNNWWVNSGGRLIYSSSRGQTVQGDLSTSDRWYREYARTNPVDTDGGVHPQNIFRLVQLGLWGNLTQQVYFKINKINLSSSPSRNASNGVFLFNRYQTSDNLYYTGLRVDGAVVVKKKIDGVYYTMAYQKIFPGPDYDRAVNYNLLPLNAWIGLKSEVTTEADNSVSINVYTDIGKTGNWTLVLQTVDDGATYGGRAIVAPGFVGIRTDFADVEFDGYLVRKN